MVADPFLDPPLIPDNIDRYVIRCGILAALKDCMADFHGRFCDVGAGNQPYRPLLEANKRVSEYVPLDLLDSGPYRPSENTWDGITMPFAENSIDTAMATEVLEHCPDPEILLCELARVLKPGGFIFVTVPFLWPLHDTPNDQYRYTPWSLDRHLESAGFRDIKIHPTGGWNAALAQMLGLYLRRGPMPPRRRRWLSRAAIPVMKYLLKRDRIPKAANYESFMMPGLFATATTKND